MVLDYSKWDKLDVSDDEDDYKRPKVIHLDKNRQVTLNSKGYSIDDPPNPANVGKLWFKRIANGTVNHRSHLFTQNRHEINALIAVNFNGKVNVEFGEKSIKIYNDDQLVLQKDFYAKIKHEDNYWNWEVITLEIDWDSLQKYYKEVRSNQALPLYFNDAKSQRFVDISIRKLNEIADCIIWWPKLFIDDVEEVTIKNDDSFKRTWEKAHERFREKVKTFEKIPI